MMRRATLEDRQTIEGLLKMRGIWEKVVDDFCPGQEWVDLTLALQAPNIVILFEEGVGVFMFYSFSGVMWDIHVATYPEARGVRVVDAVREAGMWMFDNTPCQKVIAMIPSGNLPAEALAKRMGMRKEGHLYRAFMKHGELIDLRVYGITKEDATCHS